MPYPVATVLCDPSDDAPCIYDFAKGDMWSVQTRGANIPNLKDETACVQVVHVEDMPPRGATFRDPRRPLCAASVRAMEGRGYPRLFSHQVEAIDAALTGPPSCPAPFTVPHRSTTLFVWFMTWLWIPPESSCACAC